LNLITFFKRLHYIYYLDPFYPQYTFQSSQLDPTARSPFSGENVTQHPSKIWGFDPAAGYSSYGGSITQYPPQNLSVAPTAGSSTSRGYFDQYPFKSWGFNPTAGSLFSGDNINPTANELYFSKNPSGILDCKFRTLCNVNFNN